MRCCRRRGRGRGRGRGRCEAAGDRRAATALRGRQESLPVELARAKIFAAAPVHFPARKYEAVLTPNSLSHGFVCPVCITVTVPRLPTLCVQHFVFVYVWLRDSSVRLVLD